MRKVTFGKTGLQVSVLGFGAAPIGYLDTDRQRVARVLNLLLDSGVNLIDTAASYPGAEEPPSASGATSSSSCPSAAPSCRTWTSPHGRRRT